MNALKKLFKHIKGSQLVEKILIAAFSVSGGAAVVVYGVNVIKESSTATVDEDDIAGRKYGYNQLITTAFELEINLSEDESVPNSGCWWKYPSKIWKLSGDGFLTKGHTYLGLVYTNFPEGKVQVRGAGHCENMTGIFTWGDTISSERVAIWRPGKSGDIVAGLYYIGYNCIDLTEWYGSGNEPSSISEFQSKFSKQYYQTQLTPTELTKDEINALGY